MTMVAFSAYHQAVRGRPPRPTLIRAARAARRPGFAVDLGAGEGRDALELLENGWRVLAIDQDGEALARLRQMAGPRHHLETKVARFEEVDWPPCDLVNASFSLMGCPPVGFPGLWRRIERGLRPGGRFAGQVLGPRDGWARRVGVTVLDRSTVEALLGGFDVELFDEEEHDATTPRGALKHWHIFHIVARKR